MDKTNSKIMTMSFVAFAILIGMTLNLLIVTFSAVHPALTRLAGQDWFRHGLPAVVGVGLFLYLQFSSSVRVWANDVVGEIRKVVWPSQKDTTAMSIVVIVMVLISGAIISVFDMVSGYVLKAIIQ